MDILEIAIDAERGVSALAAKLQVRQSVVSNWRSRGVPKPWEKVLAMIYRPELAQAPANSAQPATNSAIQNVAQGLR